MPCSSLLIAGRSALWAHALRLASDPQAAWDITQQTWMAIIKGLRCLNDPARFRPWAYRIVTNKAMDFLKATRPTQSLDERQLADNRLTRSPETHLDELLEMLAPAKRAILSLFCLEQLNIAEISAVLNIPKGTVKSRLFNARNELRELHERRFAE